MKDIAERLVQLDEDTKELRLSYEQKIKEVKNQGLKDLQHLEIELLDEYTKEGERLYQEILEEKSIKPGLGKIEDAILTLNSDYANIKDELVESLWSRISSVEE